MQVSANIETICLQLIGNIGSTIFDIKCSTRDHEDNNLIKMINYPETLPHFLNHLKNALHIMKRSNAVVLQQDSFGI